ncbi:hypothetical protein QTO34_000472 [Cnephaeus nilssonii]|uniref:Uncharacterized protein n=1 Tax=Cnephaeus nilssonii TaxID=3371016 RepID=A0AA40IBL0_CNENI|nr:hypothetical protein QTO34_000472 [Eptesicus nilssonii]
MKPCPRVAADWARSSCLAVGKEGISSVFQVTFLPKCHNSSIWLFWYLNFTIQFIVHQLTALKVK